MATSRRFRQALWLRTPQAQSCRTSFTLIEVLLALSLATLLVTVTGRIAIQSVMTRQEVMRAVARLEREAALFERLNDDFANMLFGLPGDKTPLMVFGRPRQVLQFSVLSVIPTSEGSLHVIRRPSTVRYRLAGDRQEGSGLDLVREIIDRTGRSAKPVRETVARSVAGFKIEVLCDGKWERKYPPAGQRAAKARAVRVSCRWVGSKQPSTRTFGVEHGR